MTEEEEKKVRTLLFACSHVTGTREYQRITLCLMDPNSVRNAAEFLRESATSKKDGDV